jgi:hypothetical protein
MSREEHHARTPFERWRALVAPPTPDRRLGPPTVDWAGVESDLGLGLPADYRAYIDAYGVGWINRLVVVAHPTTHSASLNLARSAKEQDSGPAAGRIPAGAVHRADRPPRLRRRRICPRDD